MAAFTSSVGHRHTHSMTGSNMVVLMTVTIMTTVLQGVRGHGRLMDPPARNSMWRLGFNNPVNYNDNELYCGGRMVGRFSFLSFNVHLTLLGTGCGPFPKLHVPNVYTDR